MNIKVACCVGCSIPLLIPPIAPGQDHLEPEVGILYAQSTSYDYCQNLNILFFAKSPRDHLARMFCRPGFNQPQWCVTVYEDRGRNCAVEYVAAEQWVGHSKDSLGIKVKKSSRAIDLETARVVQAVFRRMLRGVRYPDREGQGGDGDEYSFSRNVSGGGGLDREPGDPPPGSEQGLICDPDGASLTGKLVNIGQALKRYATTDPGEDRDTIRAEIRRRAEELEAEAGLPPASKSHDAVRAPPAPRR